MAYKEPCGGVAAGESTREGVVSEASDEAGEV